MKTYKSIELSVEKDNPACPDTGWPVFYFKIGNQCELEGGMMALEDATRNAVRRATKMGYLAVKLLLEGKSNRIVCTHEGGFTDIDMDEGLATKKTMQSMEMDVLAAMTGI